MKLKHLIIATDMFVVILDYGPRIINIGHPKCQFLHVIFSSVSLAIKLHAQNLENMMQVCDIGLQRRVYGSVTDRQTDR